MATRYTENALKADVLSINKQLAASASAYFYRVWPRNDCSAVDLHAIKSSGESVCVSNVESGSPRECGDRVSQDFNQYLGQARGEAEKTTLMAFTALEKFISFKKEFSQLSKDEKEMLETWNTATKMPGCPSDFFDLLKSMAPNLSDESIYSPR